MDASNSRADNRRNTFNSMDASNIMHQGKSMDATNRTNRGNIFIKLLKIESKCKVTVAQLENWVGNLRIGGSRPTCAQSFFQNTAGKFRWCGKFSRKVRPRWQNFFLLYVRIYSLRHPVWAPERQGL
jgi:hypothetical protein